MKLCHELQRLVGTVNKDLIILGDFNFPEINSESYYSINNSYGSTDFLSTIQKLFLMQHVNFPTRARGTDTPNLLDLVFTDDSIVHNINALAPLGKSDQY